jgi:hypothetical protein
MPHRDKILLQTKLNRPPITRGLIDRPRLFEQLSRGIDHPLALICAPAGYGKTTLVCTWLEHIAAGRGEKASALPSAWLSLDEEESDLDLFLRYFIAALRTIFVDACDQTLMLLQAGQQPPQAVLDTMFCNDLEKLPGEVILVLDDYHSIRGKTVHELLGELARHWPKPLHLVLISRIEPPLPLTSLRAKSRICEIRTQDLRFTAEETAAYLSQLQFAPVSQNALHHCVVLARPVPTDQRHLRSIRFVQCRIVDDQYAFSWIYQLLHFFPQRLAVRRQSLQQSRVGVMRRRLLFCRMGLRGFYAAKHLLRCYQKIDVIHFIAFGRVHAPSLACSLSTA